MNVKGTRFETNGQCIHAFVSQELLCFIYILRKDGDIYLHEK